MGTGIFYDFKPQRGDTVVCETKGIWLWVRLCRPSPGLKGLLKHRFPRLTSWATIVSRLRRFLIMSRFLMKQYWLDKPAVPHKMAGAPLVVFATQSIWSQFLFVFDKNGVYRISYEGRARVAELADAPA